MSENWSSWMREFGDTEFSEEVTWNQMRSEDPGGI